MLKNACLACIAITHFSAEVAAAQPNKNIKMLEEPKTQGSILYLFL